MLKKEVMSSAKGRRRDFIFTFLLFVSFLDGCGQGNTIVCEGLKKKL
jgi:hypothetical protein